MNKHGFLYESMEYITHYLNGENQIVKPYAHDILHTKGHRKVLYRFRIQSFLLEILIINSGIVAVELPV